MFSKKAKILSALLILAATPALSWAGTFDCAVYDKKINNGLGPDARQGDVPVEAATLAKAVKQTASTTRPGKMPNATRSSAARARKDKKPNGPGSQPISARGG